MHGRWFRTRTVVRAIIVVIAVSAAVAPTSLSAEAQGTTLRIVVIPDTQNMLSADRLPMVQEMFEWSVDNAEATSTIFVSHVGDVVSTPTSEAEWDAVAPGFAMLEQAELPYAIAPGNHDLVDDREVPYDRRFGVDRFAERPWYGGNHEAEGNRSSYSLISAGNHEWLFLHVRYMGGSEYGDNAAVYDWVNSVLAAHPDYLVALTTHTFTNGDGSLVVPEFADLIEQHCNVAMVLSGHRADQAGLGTLTDRCGRTIPHVLTNYQSFGNGGDGYLRTIDIDPATLDAQFGIYSPWLDSHRTGAAEQFDFALAPLPPRLGDIDCDRTIGTGDVMALLEYLVGQRIAEQACPLSDPSQRVAIGSADWTGSGSVGLEDAQAIIRCIETGPAGCLAGS